MACYDSCRALFGIKCETDIAFPTFLAIANSLTALDLGGDSQYCLRISWYLSCVSLTFTRCSRFSFWFHLFVFACTPHRMSLGRSPLPRRSPLLFFFGICWRSDMTTSAKSTTRPLLTLTTYRVLPFPWIPLRSPVDHSVSFWSFAPTPPISDGTRPERIGEWTCE